MKKRLDVLAVERGLVETRTKAQALILAGRLRAPDSPHAKSGTLLPEDARLELKSASSYVSRGGDKLAGALDAFGVDPRGLVCWDIGASTGGFTDCLLQRGAAAVVAVDVGRDQLHEKLRGDPRVKSFEKTHVMEADPSLLGWPAPSLVVIDVSFISLVKVAGRIFSWLPAGTDVVALVKPQFEAGPKGAPGGVVRDPDVRVRVVRETLDALLAAGFSVLASEDSVLKGPKGNQETFVHLRTEGRQL